MSTSISETIKKTNKHLIRKSFLFTKESIKGAGGPKEGPLQPIGAPNFLIYLAFFCVLQTIFWAPFGLIDGLNPLSPALVDYNFSNRSDGPPVIDLKGKWP